MGRVMEEVKPFGAARQAVGLIAWLLATFAAAGLGGYATGTSVGDWYQHIAKPAWTPPDWIFGPAWTTLYALMAIAAWLVWRRGGFSVAGNALALFIVQLVLNAVWSVLFFGMRRPDLAAVEVIALWLAILVTIVAFWRHSRAAAMLLIPYMLWVSYASALNVAIAYLNH